jgi:Protein of unknown function (DUF3455)
MWFKFAKRCFFIYWRNLMKHTIFTLTALAIVVALSGCASLAPASNNGSLASPGLPAAIAAPADQKIAFTWQALGTQIYECKMNEKAVPAWIFIAPEAVLMNAKNEKVGMHGAGPFWMALDGSRVVGAVKGRAPSASTQDIPLLLLEVQSSSGQGKMSGIKNIQRLNTQGGQGPAAGCAVAADLGKRSAQGYTSDYVFWVMK